MSAVASNDLIVSTLCKLYLAEKSLLDFQARAEAAKFSRNTLSTELHLARENFYGLQREYKSMEQSRNHFKNKCHKLAEKQVEFNQAAAELASTRRELGCAKGLLGERSEYIRELEQQLERLNRDHTAALEEIAKLEKKESANRADLSDSQHELATVLKATGNHLKPRSAMCAICGAMYDELRKLRIGHDEVESKLAEEKSARAKAEKELAVARAEVSSMILDEMEQNLEDVGKTYVCLLYTSPSPRDH
jgi:chromosome segregation ATPase